MSRKHISKRLLALVMVTALASTAAAQNLETMELWRPADLSSYGRGKQPNVGYFFNFDYLGWWIPMPEVTEIGDPTAEGITVWRDDLTSYEQYNTFDTSFFGAEYKHGQRVEFGRVSRDGHGWFLSTYRFGTMNQRINVTGAIDVCFNSNNTEDGLLWGYTPVLIQGSAVSATSDSGSSTASSALYQFYEKTPPYDPVTDGTLGRLPVTFDEGSFRLKVKTWSVEANYLKRFRPFHHGGNLEVFAGCRYFQFDDSFDVELTGTDRWVFFDGRGGGDVGTGDDDDDDTNDDDSGGTGRTGSLQIAPRAALSDTYWVTEAQNRVVGPQIGFRWFKLFNRWTLSCEGRFLAGYNAQTVRQRGRVGTELANGYDEGSDEGEEGSSSISSSLTQYRVYTPYRMLQAVGFDYREFKGEWSPAAELRLQAAYQITNSVSFRAGWTGFWMDGLARSSTLTTYNLFDGSETAVKYKVMGIDMDKNRQDIFTHGINVGIEINR